MKNILLLIIAALFLSFVLHKDTIKPANFKIYSSNTLKESTVNDIISEMKNYDVVFFGEEHNDSVGHFLELEIFKGLYTSFGNQIVLSMEMFESDCQLVLDEYLQGFIREKNFIKETRAWKNYRDYKPLIEFAKEKKLNVIAANSPARYVNMAARNGRNSLNELSKTAKSFLPPLPYDTAVGKYYEKFMSVMADGRSTGATSKDTSNKIVPVSNGMMPKYVVHSQSLWDATMAYSISRIFMKNKNAKVLQLNGRFHSDEGLGIVTHLKKHNPKLRVLVISCINGDKDFPNAIDSGKNKILGDYVIYTDPAVPKTFKE
ncbi:MAG: ChaN family lipoprotein [Bacteroidetes bacterium]|nr:ChaN family lipoprotein [Bacteroidota bacterium]